MTAMKPRSTFGAQTAAPSTGTAPAPNPNAKKEVGAIWENTSKSSGELFYKVQMNIPKELLQDALSKATGDTVGIGFIAFPNKSHNGDNSRPKIRIFEDKKR